MEAGAIGTVSVSVVSLTQILKWAGVTDKFGPILVLILSAVGVGFWGWTQADFARDTAFEYFAGWVVVTTSAAGVYGYTRASGDALTRMQAPPTSGAGSEPTVKSDTDGA